MIVLFLTSCESKTNQQSIDVFELDSSYLAYKNYRYDAGFSEADSLLQGFKSIVVKKLSSKYFNEFYSDSLTSVKMIRSKDEKLHLISWDELNGGTWHLYNSAYGYTNNGKRYSNYLTKGNGNDDDGNLNFTDVISFKIQSFHDKYLITGYGTHGHGHDFYTMRLMSFEDEELIDCNSCFEGENRFVFYKPRGDEFVPKLDIEAEVIVYPEYDDDPNDNGFSSKTGNMIILKWNGDKFIRTE